MARKRTGAGVVDLPKGVHPVRVGAATYYYWQPGRGTASAAPRVSLGKDPRHPDFWKKLDALRGVPTTLDAPFKGSWAALDRDWRGDEEGGLEPSREWNALAHGTRRIYALRMRQIVKGWGGLQVALTDLVGVTALRDTIPGAVAANQLVGVLRAAMKWGRAHGYPSQDPTAGLAALDVGEIDGATPWPEWAFKIVREEAPEPLRRAAFLGRATGQRRSDLVRIGKRNRRDDGIEFRILKLRDKRHFIPLLDAELKEIDRWPTPEVGPYITIAGKPTTGDHLAYALKSFCLGHPLLKQAEVYLHGLRALAVCDRRMQGLSHQEIAAQLGMTPEMVMRYSKAIDTEALSRAANTRRAAAAPGGNKKGMEKAEIVKTG